MSRTAAAPKPPREKARKEEVTIRAIASSGSGLGDLTDGRVVFVPLTAPGDRARIRIEKEHARWAAGSLDRLLEASKDRVAPECSLYGSCGGCQLQHLAYDRQLEWKGRFIADALQRIGRMGDVEPPTVVPSPEPYGYRNRVTYTLRRLRSGQVVAGFHALGRPAHVLDVTDECRLPDDQLAAAWTRLRATWGPGAAYLPSAGRLRLTLRGAAQGVELVVEGGVPGWNGSKLLDAGADFTAIWHRAEDQTEVRLVGGMASPGGGMAFAQVNDAAADLLRAAVLEACEAGAPGTVVDAYCGAGEYGRRLAERGWRATGIEVDAQAVAAAQTDPPDGFAVVSAKVEDALGAHLPADLLLVNPPRTGLDREVTDLIVGAPAARLVYVSCDPATLARDLGALSNSYHLESLRAFDLFPQTAHVETVAVLARTVS